jgi:hypothetical protein
MHQSWSLARLRWLVLLFRLLSPGIIDPRLPLQQAHPILRILEFPSMACSSNLATSSYFTPLSELVVNARQSPERSHTLFQIPSAERFSSASHVQGKLNLIIDWYSTPRAKFPDSVVGSTHSEMYVCNIDDRVKAGFDSQSGICARRIRAFLTPGSEEFDHWLSKWYSRLSNRTFCCWSFCAGHLLIFKFSMFNDRPKQNWPAQYQ